MKTMAPLIVAALLCLGIQSSALTTEFKMNRSTRASEREFLDVCEDCTEIYELVVDILTNPDIQKRMMDSIEVVCDHLPNPSTSSKICRQQVEQILPMAINFITASVKPEQVCSFLGLCASHLEDGDQEMADIQNRSPIQCTYCMIILDALEKMFPKEKIESLVSDVLLGACGLLPDSYQPKCEALVDSFSKSVLDTLLSHVTAKTICSLIQLCGGQDGLLDSRAFVDPCTVQSLRCRDVLTAVRCGTVTFCERFAWKSP